MRTAAIISAIVMGSLAFSVGCGAAAYLAIHAIGKVAARECRAALVWATAE